MAQFLLLYIYGMKRIRKFKILFGLILSFSIAFEVKYGKSNNINSYPFLIGNSAISEDENIYSHNPASICLSANSFLNQIFFIAPTKEKVIFSQDLLLKISKNQSFLIGYSLNSKNEISLKTSEFKLTYSFGLLNFIYLGINFNYKDDDYKKFKKENLVTDIGLIFSLKLGERIKFINFGIFGNDANIEKLTLNLPNTNYGKNSFLGVSTGLGISKKIAAIISFDTELVRDNIILKHSEKMKYIGIQLNFGLGEPLFSIKFLNSIYKNNSIYYSAGIKLGLKYFDLNYGINSDYSFKQKTEYLSITFRLRDEKPKQDEKNDIKMYYYKEDSVYKILFSGRRENIVYWKLTITDEEDRIVKEFSSLDNLPDYIIWDGKDMTGKETKSGIYKAKLYYIRDKFLLTIYKNEKKLYKEIID